MKRTRQSWATRKLPPLTIEEIEGHLDYLAWVVDRWPDLAELAVPLWRRWERERDALKDATAILAQARERARRLPDRTAARSS